MYLIMRRQMNLVRYW